MWQLATELQKQQKYLQTTLDTCGVSVRVFKTVKWTTQLAGVLGGVYAMTLGADPLTALGLLVLMVHGPELAETVLQELGHP